MCFSLLFVQYPWGGSLPRTVSDCYSPIGPRSVNLPALQNQVIQRHPTGLQPQKLGHRTQKPGHQTQVKAPLQEILVLWSVAQE